MSMVDETHVLSPELKGELPDAIRRACGSSGIFLIIEVPGLGRAIVVDEGRLGELVRLFKDESFAASLERGLSAFASRSGQTRGEGIMPEDERRPLCEPEMGESMPKALSDFRHGRGKVRDADDFPS